MFWFTSCCSPRRGSGRGWLSRVDQLPAPAYDELEGPGSGGTWNTVPNTLSLALALPLSLARALARDKHGHVVQRPMPAHVKQFHMLM